MTPLEQELTTRIARALEKIAEKDFGNKTISAHRITALKTIKDTKQLVASFIKDKNDIIDAYIQSGKETTDLRGQRNILITIFNSLN